MKRIAVGLWGGMPMDDLIGCITLADRAGYEAAFLIESYADQFCVLAACARETERIKLGTGVTTVFNRTPTSVAIAGATVDALSHGRFVLGLGAGHSEIVRMRDDVEPARPLPFERPLQRLRETVESVHAVVAAAMLNEHVSYKGEIFEIREYLPWISAHRGRYPVYVGAFFEKAFELAGAVADGTMPIFMPLANVESYVAAVRRGATAAGRDPDEVDIACYIPCCVSDDEEQARTAMRYLVAFHMAEYANYRKHFEAQGHGALVARIGELLASGRAADAASLVTDEVVEGITVAGNAETCARRIDDYRAAGIKLPIVYPIFPEFVGYLPNAASHAGIVHTVEALASA